jgi:protein-glucosylgalactosylhydroxylysine glucosidase
VELRKGRIRLIGADERWQALADAAFFYLHSSVHSSSPASTSIFGLATWHDYHYYYGHVMWDIEAFAVPVLSLQQPGAAEAILDYRTRTLKSARHNASLMGRRGVQFAWESAPSTGDEASPVPGTAAWHEDHVSLDVARAFAFHADVCGERDFRRDKAWPVLSGVAEWITSRVAKTGRGYEVRASVGIAVLARRGRAVISHDGYRRNEEKGATPDPLMGIWPFGFLADEVATLSLYLDQAQDYIGSPMLSALYGVWASRSGDRKLALKLR